MRIAPARASGVLRPAVLRMSSIVQPQCRSPIATTCRCGFLDNRRRNPSRTLYQINANIVAPGGRSFNQTAPRVRARPVTKAGMPRAVRRIPRLAASTGHATNAGCAARIGRPWGQPPRCDSFSGSFENVIEASASAAGAEQYGIDLVERALGLRRRFVQNRSDMSCDRRPHCGLHDGRHSQHAGREPLSARRRDSASLSASPSGILAGAEVFPIVLRVL